MMQADRNMLLLIGCHAELPMRRTVLAEEMNPYVSVLSISDRKNTLLADG